MDRKAEKAQQHRLFSHLCLMMMIMMKYNYTDNDSQQNENVVSEELRRGREDAVRRIEGYHRHIDNCTAEMRKFLILFPSIENFLLRIQLKLNTALLSTVRPCVRHRRDTSHFSHI